jgi:hypothetical protein
MGKLIKVDTELLRSYSGGYKEHSTIIGKSGEKSQNSILMVASAMPDYDGRLQQAARSDAMEIGKQCRELSTGFMDDSNSLIRIATAFERVDNESVENLTIYGASLLGVSEGLVAMSPASIEKSIGQYHQNQGDTTHCGDFSLSMVCNIYYDRMGESTSRCEVGKITEFLDLLPIGRFPDISKFPSPEWLIGGGATPAGITAALLSLGIPFSFNPTGTIDDLENALRDGKFIIVSEGKLMDPNYNNQTWGHVMVIVGEDGEDFLFLDPSAPKGSGVTRINKNDFLGNWWFDPAHPCWIVG